MNNVMAFKENNGILVPEHELVIPEQKHICIDKTVLRELKEKGFTREERRILYENAGIEGLEDAVITAGEFGRFFDAGDYMRNTGFLYNEKGIDRLAKLIKDAEENGLNPDDTDIKRLSIAPKKGLLYRLYHSNGVQKAVAAGLLFVSGLMPFQFADTAYAKGRGPIEIVKTGKVVRLEKIDKQAEFGVGVEYIPEDFYYDKDVRDGRRIIHRKGMPVSVVKAEYRFRDEEGIRKYSLYLFDTSKDDKFTPQTAPFRFHLMGLLSDVEPVLERKLERPDKMHRHFLQESQSPFFQTPYL